MKENIKPKNYWTKEKCLEKALEYNTKNEFRKSNKGAYESSRKNGWLEDICSHMKPLNNAHYRCIYSIEFIESNSVYIGLTYSMSIRQAKRINRSGDTVTKYIKDTGYVPIYKQLTDYVDVELAIGLEGEYVNIYKNNGWNILNIAKTGGIGWTGRKHRFDNIDNIKSIINQYSSVIDLMKRNNALYLKIKDNGWRDVFYPMLNYKKRYPTSFWTKENLIEFAKKSGSRKCFKKEFTCAYRVACKNKWQDEVYLESGI